jgi:hypothetical protein
MNPDSAKPPLKPGSRVRCKHSAVTGTVLAMPGAHSGSPDLFAVLDDAGEFRAVHPTLLEPTDESDGFRISRQMLIEKREGLFHDLLCLVAASRRANLSDPRTRMQIEAEVRRMSASWADADTAALRRKEFLENPALRKRLIGSLTKYLDLGDLLDQVAELIEANSS